MLVLSRKQRESVVISDNVVVTVLSIQGDKVRLGIEAPGKCRCIARKCMRGYKTGRSDAGIPGPVPSLSTPPRHPIESMQQPQKIQEARTEMRASCCVFF